MEAGSNKDVAGKTKLVTGGSSLSFFFILYLLQTYRDIWYYQDRKGKDLFQNLYNQGKNTREIAQEVRMSFSAIGAILKKAEEEKGAEEQEGQKMSLSSQAYKLFSERRTLAQIAIALNLRA